MAHTEEGAMAAKATWIKVATVGSFTSEKKYAITYDPQSRRVRCACPAYLFGNGNACKHLVALQAQLKGLVVLHEEAFR
jgi:hypothetical protein